MARPMVADKLRIPVPRLNSVARPRLMERLAPDAGSRLTLVSAPAGYGKTTLLAEWLQQAAGDGGRTAWLSLEASERDPATFWGCVVAALQTVMPGIGAAALELAQVSPFPTELVLTAVLNELAAEAPALWLVLDDYHLVDGRELGEGMAFLLEHLPPQLHIVISTRADPLLPLPRWRVRGELAEIREADLRFTPGEADAYLNGAAGLDLAADDVKALEQRTEGWIAALQLAALTLRGHQDTAAFIARFAGDDRFILDYLVEEVLGSQPEDVRTFLLETAVLERFTGRLCDAVTGRDGGSGMLAALDRANLFLIPLDDKRQWYRYHHLFADVLRARLLSEHPERMPLLHQRASHWYQDHGFVPEAVKHALAAPDLDRAAHLMELAAAGIRRNRQDSMMHAWLKELPADVIRRSPVLSVFRGFMLLAAGELDGVEPHLADAERALAAAPAGADSPWADVEEFQILPASIAIYRASLAQARGDVAGTTAHARHALDLAGPGDHFVRGAGAGFLGLAAWAQGDVSTALQAFGQAAASLHAAGNLVDELSTTVILADLWLAAGRPGRARQLLDQALQVAQALGESAARAAAELHVGLGEIECEAGDADAAAAHLRSAGGFVEHGPMTESRYRWFVAAALLAQAEEDPVRAIECLGQAEPLFRPGFFPDVRPIAAMRARIWIGQGQLAEAADWAREKGISATDDSGFLGEFNQLTLVRLHLAQHRAAAQQAQAGTASARQLDAISGPLLERLAAAAEAAGRAGSLLEIRMLVALVHDAQGRRGAALAALGSAFAEAPEPEGCVRLFLAEGAPMLALLHDAARHSTANPKAAIPKITVDHAARLLGLAPPSAAHPGGGPASNTGAMSTGKLSTGGMGTEPLSERERQVLRLLGSELGGPQIAGELFISYNTLRTHTKHIYTKLGVTDRRAAVRSARERGLL